MSALSEDRVSAATRVTEDLDRLLDLPRCPRSLDCAVTAGIVEAGLSEQAGGAGVSRSRLALAAGQGGVRSADAGASASHI